MNRPDKVHSFKSKARDKSFLANVSPIFAGFESHLAKNQPSPKLYKYLITSFSLTKRKVSELRIHKFKFQLRETSKFKNGVKK